MLCPIWRLAFFALLEIGFINAFNQLFIVKGLETGVSVFVRRLAHDKALILLDVAAGLLADQQHVFLAVVRNGGVQQEADHIAVLVFHFEHTVVLVGIIRIRINGKGGHGAHCHTLRDPIVASAAVINALQTLVSRETNPANAVVISICTIHAGEANNIVPDSVEMTGTVRTLNPADRDRMEASVKRVAASVAEAYRCTADVEYNRGVPPFICEDEWVDRALRVGKKMLGEENTKIMPYAAMGGEDFAFIKEKKPGIFVRLGARTPGGAYGSAHSPTFYCDNACIPVGMLTIIGLAADYLDFEV